MVMCGHNKSGACFCLPATAYTILTSEVYVYVVMVMLCCYGDVGIIKVELFLFTSDGLYNPTALNYC